MLRHVRTKRSKIRTRFVFDHFLNTEFSRKILLLTNGLNYAAAEDSMQPRMKNVELIAAKAKTCGNRRPTPHLVVRTARQMAGARNSDANHSRSSDLLRRLGPLKALCIAMLRQSELPLYS